jgi:hypothetical protein
LSWNLPTISRRLAGKTTVTTLIIEHDGEFISNYIAQVTWVEIVPGIHGEEGRLLLPDNHYVLMYKLRSDNDMFDHMNKSLYGFLLDIFCYKN